MKIELDLSNYATKPSLKDVTGADTLKFAKKVDLVNLKLEIDKLHIGKLETTPIDLSKLRDVVKHEVVKKTEYNELVKKVMLLRLLILVL